MMDGGEKLMMDVSQKISTRESLYTFIYFAQLGILRRQTYPYRKRESLIVFSVKHKKVPRFKCNLRQLCRVIIYTLENGLAILNISNYS